MFGFKKYYSGYPLKNYDLNERKKILTNIFLNDFNAYTPKDFLNLKQIYDSNKLSYVIKQIQKLRYSQNKVSVPFLECLFYSKYNLELLPIDLKIKNAFESIFNKLDNNYKIKEFSILNKSQQTFNVNLLFLISYNKKGKLHCDLIYQDANDKAIENFKKLLDDILENNSSYFLKYYDDKNLFQDYVVSGFILNNKKDQTNYFVNKFNYDFDSPFFRQMHHDFLYRDKSKFDDEFDFEEFDEYFDSEIDDMFEDEIDFNNLSRNDCYELFGLTNSATIAEIKRAYRTKARMYHPDINKTEEGEKKFKEINAAYRILLGKDSKTTKIN